MLVVEPQVEQWRDDPWEIKSQNLDTMSYPVPKKKYRYTYEVMLIESGSVEIIHTYEKYGQKKPIQLQ